MDQDRTAFTYQRSDRIALFDHYAAWLGPVTANWNARTIPKEDFRILGFGQAMQDRRTLCTFGLSDHCLHDAGRADGARLEYMFVVAGSCSATSIAALLMAIGMHALEKHFSPGLHGIVAGKGPVLFEGNPRFEHFYLAAPLGFAAGFAACERVQPSTELAQLIPISSAEKRFIETHGWKAFEDRLASRRIDVSLFDQREEVAF